MVSVWKPTRKKEGKRVKYRHYYYSYRDHTGKRVIQKGYTDRAATRELAERKQKEADRKREGIPTQVQERKDYQGALEEYLAEMVRRGSPPGGSNHAGARQALTRWARECGWKATQDINTQQVESKLGSWSKESMAPATQNLYHTRLNHFCSYCQRRGWLAHNPVQGIQKAKVGERGKRRRRRAYTPSELARLLQVAGPRALVYQLAAWSGFRRKEVRQLQKQDCDPHAGVWHPRPEILKRDRREWIPMTVECAQLLKELWDTLPEPTSRLVPHVPKAKTLNRDLAKAGIAKQDHAGRVLDFHSLRYFFCTRLASVLPIQKVMVLMRHRSITLTANLYLDLGLTDVMEDNWSVPPLGVALTQAQAQSQKAQESVGKPSDPPFSG
jgi:integrase